MKVHSGGMPEREEVRCCRAVHLQPVRTCIATPKLFDLQLDQCFALVANTCNTADLQHVQERAIDLRGEFFVIDTCNVWRLHASQRELQVAIISVSPSGDKS